MENRWTIRGVDADAVELVRLVRQTCGLTTGELVSDAIRIWFSGLPELDDQEDETSLSDGGP